MCGFQYHLGSVPICISLSSFPLQSLIMMGSFNNIMLLLIAGLPIIYANQRKQITHLFLYVLHKYFPCVQLL